MSIKDNLDYYTMTPNADGVNVYGWGVYPKNSVLAGQPRKVFIDHFDTVEEAKAEYPDANFSGPLTEPEVSLNHLPDGPDL